MERKIGEVKIPHTEHLIDCMRYFVEGLKNMEGEKKMDKKEELLKSMQEEEQRAKDSLANVEKMKKQLEELDKKVEVSATGVLINKEIEKDCNYFYVDSNNKVCCLNNCFSYISETININNLFISKHQAEQEALRREIQEYIRRFAMLNNANNDWRKKENTTQYCIRMFGNNIDTDYFSNNQYGQPNFDTKALAEKCIAELNKKYAPEQLKTGFGVI